MTDNYIKLFYPSKNLIKDILGFFIFTYVPIGALTNVIVKETNLLEPSLIKLGAAMFLWFIFAIIFFSTIIDQIKNNFKKIEKTQLGEFLDKNSISKTNALFNLLLTLIGVIILFYSTNEFTLAITDLFDYLVIFSSEQLNNLNISIQSIIYLIAYVIGGLAYITGVDRVFVYLIQKIIKKLVPKK